jgi:predicted RNA polymerase sigma factor
VITDRRVQDLLRELTPQVPGALTRRYGSFGQCEDAVQEALLAAATSWPGQGIPENPRGWLITAAARRLTDEIRSDSARRRREERVARLSGPGDVQAWPPDAELGADRDDSLLLLFLCCHPALPPAAGHCRDRAAPGCTRLARRAGRHQGRSRPALRPA